MYLNSIDSLDADLTAVIKVASDYMIACVYVIAYTMGHGYLKFVSRVFSRRHRRRSECTAIGVDRRRDAGGNSS